jgi:formate dehydrogenase major subunit
MPTAEYPVVATTFRLTEHYLSGPMSRFNSWLNELQPEMFAELSYELAAERGIVHGGWMTIQTPRGAAGSDLNQAESERAAGDGRGIASCAKK